MLSPNFRQSHIRLMFIYIYIPWYVYISPLHLPSAGCITVDWLVKSDRKRRQGAWLPAISSPRLLAVRGDFIFHRASTDCVRCTMEFYGKNISAHLSYAILFMIFMILHTTSIYVNYSSLSSIIYIYMYVCMSVCMYVCMYVCVSV